MHAPRFVPSLDSNASSVPPTTPSHVWNNGRIFLEVELSEHLFLIPLWLFSSFSMVQVSVESAFAYIVHLYALQERTAGRSACNAQTMYLKLN